MREPVSAWWAEHLRGLQFKRSFGGNSATFGTEGNREILITGLPRDREFTRGGWYDVVVAPLGVAAGKTAYGGPVSTPHARFVGLP